MKLQTKIPLSPSEQLSLDHKQRILLLGSCFAENIGEKLQFYQFRSSINPLGITYNPFSLERQIGLALEKQKPDPERWVQKQSGWVHLDAHSRIFGKTMAEAQSLFNEALAQLCEELKNSSVIFLTLGTAWGYRHLNTDQVVANCHQLPARDFQKELLTIEQIKNSLESAIDRIANCNPSVQIVFTVSPVRHLKDGFTENLHSKSQLISAVLGTIAQYENCAYFPAYELMQDELRDYRFYAEDMVHPNALAIDYIWERFMEVYASAKAREVMPEVEQIQRALAHRPVHPESEAHQEFLKQLEGRIERLQVNYPHLAFQKRGH